LLGYDTCRDAAALAEFWCWLEEEICKTVPLTEVDVAEKLLEFRQKQDGFIETSFDTISGMIFFVLDIKTIPFKSHRNFVFMYFYHNSLHFVWYL
jgi:hypothetical protein